MDSTDTTTTSGILAAELAELSAQLPTHIPAERAAVFAAEQAALDAAGVPEGVATPGTPMPDADLLDVHGAATTLAAARGGRPAVIFFYRGAWCPYCNKTVHEYEAQVRPELSAKGVELIALSPQKPDGSLTTKEANELTFTVLSDPGNRIAEQLGVLTAVSEEAREAQLALGLDVAAGNADGTVNVPMPTTVVVDASGTIRWIDVHPNYATRTEPADILAAVAATVG